jgi:hypothetical protein
MEFWKRVVKGYSRDIPGIFQENSRKICETFIPSSLGLAALFTLSAYIWKMGSDYYQFAKFYRR